MMSGNPVIDTNLMSNIIRTKTGLEKQKTDKGNDIASGVIPGFDEMDAAREMAE